MCYSTLLAVHYRYAPCLQVVGWSLAGLVRDGAGVAETVAASAGAVASAACGRRAPRRRRALLQDVDPNAAETAE